MKSGFKVLDSDLHTMEPDGLWEKYLDAPFKKFAPLFTRRSENASNQPVIRIGALEIGRSEEHTSELQSRPHLVCRLLLEKKNTRGQSGAPPHRPRNRSA